MRKAVKSFKIIRQRKVKKLTNEEIECKEEVIEIRLTDRIEPLKILATHQNLLVKKHEHKHTVDDLSQKIRESKARALEAKRREEEMKIKDAEFQVLPDPQPEPQPKPPDPDAQPEDQDSQNIDVF